MKNPMIAKVLKEQRKRKSLTIYEVVDKLKENNVSVAVKTIYGWESGQTQPDADTLLKLCDIYEIDNILCAFGYVQPGEEEIKLSPDEKEVICKYREKTEMQDAVRKLLDVK